MTFPEIKSREIESGKKRVWCLYRVSTKGQVDKDDIPMQRLSCHEFIDQRSDWMFVRELQEKGVSGFKLKSSERDVLTEVMEAAAAKQFDVLSVFMFDRLGRRDDETPFVARWFVEQGIEVWSVKEGQQRFDSHVDSLIAYIYYWQAAGESIKTSMRVRERQLQMLQEGIYRGGKLPYGYNAVFKGRANKKGQQVRDYEINADEAEVVKLIFHKIVDDGWGTNRVANWLNSQHIPTKRGNYMWRGTPVRVVIGNPIYVGVIRFGSELSPPFESLRIIDDSHFVEALRMVKSRNPKLAAERDKPMSTNSRALLTGIIYCADCGSRMTFNHQKITRKNSTGTHIYERDMYRCYRKINASTACSGQSTFTLDRVEEPVLNAVRHFFKHVAQAPKEGMLKTAVEREQKIKAAALKAAEANLKTAQVEMKALEDVYVKALTGESGVDVDFVNQALMGRRLKLEEAASECKRIREEIDDSKDFAKEHEFALSQMCSWADAFDSADHETKKMILSHLIERVEVGKDYKIEVKFKLTVKQFLGEVA